jgi:hypothetical protein
MTMTHHPTVLIGSANDLLGNGSDISTHCDESVGATV